MDTTTITKVAVGASVVTVLALNYSKWKQNRVPQKWIKVGEVSDLFFFPIKSCGKMDVKKVDCTKLGVKQDFLCDRTFMVTKEPGERFVTARQYPALVKVMPNIYKDMLKLSAVNMEDIEVNIQEVVEKKVVMHPEMWDNAPVEVFDCGAEVAKWLSKFVLKEEKGLRLVYYPLNHPTRVVRPMNQRFPETSPEHVGALHDATSFMMINEGSVADLNTRLNFVVTPLFFRPNFVIKGPKAFDEDDYKWIKFGNGTIMRVVQPCTRCTFTNIDPETGERRADGQPLKTLKEYRKFPHLDDGPVMGIHLGVVKAGSVKVGDPVYVQDH